MRLFHRFILALVLCGLSLTAQAGDALKQGAELTAAFYDSRIDDIWARMTPRMQEALKSRDGLAAFRQQVGDQLGKETSVVSETIESEQGLSIYLRRAHFEKVAVVVIVQWALDDKGSVAGF